MKKLEDHSILAWVGEDEHGSGVIGIKQAQVPAGFIPLAVDGFTTPLSCSGPSCATRWNRRPPRTAKRSGWCGFASTP